MKDTTTPLGMVSSDAVIESNLGEVVVAYRPAVSALPYPILKVMGKKQGNMRQSIEKKRESRRAEMNVTVMFHGRTACFGSFYSFGARDHAALSLSAALTGEVLMPAAAPSLPSSLKVAIPRSYSRHITRKRSLPHIEKFSAEVPEACSALAVFAAILNSCGAKAAANPTTKITEQRRCAA